MKALILFLPSVDPGFTETGEVASGSSVLTLLFQINLVLNILPYILTAIGLYSIASRRGIRHAWLAWVPIADLWILGSISDDYQLKVNGRVKSVRKILIGLAAAILAVILVFKLMGNILSPTGYKSMLPAILFTYSIVGIGSVLVVVRFMALSDLYRSCYSKIESLYIILSILLNFLEPVLIFHCRNWDIGMYEHKWKKSGVSQK